MCDSDDAATRPIVQVRNDITDVKWRASARRTLPPAVLGKKLVGIARNNDACVTYSYSIISIRCCILVPESENELREDFLRVSTNNDKLLIRERGLINVGNTCYGNSIIQVHNPLFRRCLSVFFDISLYPSASSTLCLLSPIIAGSG